MKKVLFLIGLPGSGKTTYAKKFLKQTKSFLFDDVFLDSQLEELKALYNSGVRNIVVTSPVLCTKEAQEKCFSLFPESDVVYFENNIENCWANIIKRNDKEKIITKDYLLRLSSKYFIPENAQILQVEKY